MAYKCVSLSSIYRIFTLQFTRILMRHMQLQAAAKWHRVKIADKYGGKIYPCQMKIQWTINSPAATEVRKEQKVIRKWNKNNERHKSKWHLERHSRTDTSCSTITEQFYYNSRNRQSTWITIFSQLEISASSPLYFRFLQKSIEGVSPSDSLESLRWFRFAYFLQLIIWYSHFNWLTIDYSLTCE